MITYFKKLFAYDRHTNLVMINALQTQGFDTGKPAEIMAHTLAAQQIWLLRCKNLPAPGGPQWPKWTVKAMIDIVEQNNKDWIDYLDDLQNGDIENAITYQTSRGDTYTNTIAGIITHVINHGTHHRSQIGQQLKIIGANLLPATDYILYIREQ